MPEILELIKTFGLPLALVVFFVWRDYVREDRLSKRLNTVEDYQKNQLQEVIITSNTTLKEIGHLTRDLVQALRRRPCLLKEELDAPKQS